MVSNTFVPAPRRRFVSNPDVSRTELVFFRLVERLSKGCAGCVCNFATLAGMLKRCERQAWTLWRRLVSLGWVAYRVYRKRGKSYFEFWPCVRVSERSEPIFLRKKTALWAAPSTPENCTLVEGTYKTLLTAKQEDDKQTSAKPKPEPVPEPCPVAVSILKEVCPDSEALELAREASRHKLTEDQVRRTVAAYKGQVKNILNRGAWLRSALRRGFSPALSPSPHTSDQGGLPVAKKVTFTKEQLFGSQSKNTPAVQTAKAPVASHKAILGTPGAMPDLGRIQARIESLKTRTA